jgi:hypothetical protein
MRLFICACARRVWNQLPPGSIKDSVVVAEAYARGELTLVELAYTHRMAEAYFYANLNLPDIVRIAVACSLPNIENELFSRILLWPSQTYTADILRDVARNPSFPYEGLCGGIWAPPDAGARHVGCRDCERVRTKAVLDLAKVALADRDSNGRMDNGCLAALADALEEEGYGPSQGPCQECGGDGKSHQPPATTCWACLGGGTSALLAHLRSPGNHYLGCWAVDLVTGKG